jgi:glutathione S-transferase
LIAQAGDAELAAINARLGAANAALIRRAAGIFAVLDGTDVDSGTAAEIGYASGLGRAIVGLRTDFRMAGDNAATPINLQVLHFIEASGGAFATEIDKALAALVARVPTSDETPRIFHLAERATWALAKASGSYANSTRDQSLAEVGFIHCSFEQQLAATAARFYADADPHLFVVLVIDPSLLDARLVEEQAGNGELFPHIYGPLNVDAVVATRPLIRRDGEFILGAAAPA